MNVILVTVELTSWQLTPVDVEMPRIQKKYDVCADTKDLLDKTKLLEAHAKLDDFHNAGGNLKSIEEYLNNQIDPTLSRLNISFTPKNSNSSIRVGIRKEIHKLMVEGDKNNRGGYDQRNWHGRLNYHESIKEYLRGRRDDERFDVTEPDNMQSRWKAGLGPIINTCKSVDVIKSSSEVRMKRHEEKLMCSVPIISNQSCGEMMSIGSNGEWGFENVITSVTDCKIHTFDCTVAQPNKPRNPSIQFYPYCLGKQDKNISNREYMSYFSMLKKANINSAPKLLKIDVEGFEYDIFTSMLLEANSNNMRHLLPQQVAMELHYSTRMYDLDWQLRYRQAAEIAMFVGLMFRKGGYVLVHTKFTRGCSPCMEVLFVRTFCN